MINILVPTDFTKVSDCAINHATSTALFTKGIITLLHVVPKKKELKEARLKLNSLADIITSKEPTIQVNIIARIGSIFEDIPHVAEELNVDMIILGTHGIRGMQFLTGSRALKIVTESDVPFIVVQERNIKKGGYKDIVVPLDLQKETKQKLGIVSNIAKYFNSKIHLITPKETDEFLKNQLTRNMQYAERYLKEKGIEYTATISTESQSGIEKAVVKHAGTVEADLICIMNFQANSLLGMIANQSMEQHLITNAAQIPVMLVKAKTASKTSGIFTMGGGD